MSGWILLVIVVLPLLWLWLAAIVEVVRRPGRSIGRRIAWVAALLLVPLIALVAYVIVRAPPVLRRSGASGVSPEALRFVELAERRQRGDVSDEAYRSEVASLFDVAET